jgi:hypothetical protein
MVRPRDAGASISTADLKLSSDGESDIWPAPVPVTRNFIGSAAQDFLEGASNTAPGKFLHCLIRNFACGVASQEALLRRYPWVLQVFHERQRKNREEQAGVVAFQQERQIKKKV